MSVPRKTMVRGVAVLLCFLLLGSGDAILLAQEAASAQKATPDEAAAPKLTADQLDSLVAPVALYPDPLLAQTLVAATYPLELIQLQQWLAKNKGLKDKALADAVAKQPWDPAIQSMAAVPDVVKRLSDDIQWTTQLGDAFLDQQSEVMDAVQRMRGKAQEKGSLKSNEQQIVEKKVVEEKTVIIVQPSNPEVIYVPSYNPTVVYPPPVYPYPPVYYPPYTAGAALVTFGVGMAMGAAIWGGSCCGCAWGGNNVNINVNNNFNKNVNANINRSGNNNWQHNAQHRGGAPYSNKATASKYGGSGRGASASTRQASSRAGGASASTRAGGASASSRAGASASSTNRGGGSGSRSSGGNYAGSRSIPQSSSRGGSSFSGASGGASSANRARSSSSRGASSMGSRSGGGGRRR